MNWRCFPHLPPVVTAVGTLLGCGSGDNSRDVGEGSISISGMLAPSVRGELVQAVGAETPVIIALLRGVDCFTCDQLGRRLREFARSAPPDYRWVVITDTSGASRTRGYLKRERIRYDLLLPLDSLIVFRGRQAVATPAVVVAASPVDSFHGVARLSIGISPNLRSLAQELGFDKAVPTETEPASNGGH